RETVGRPALDSDGEGLLDRVLGEVDIAEDAGQGGHRAAGAFPEDPRDDAPPGSVLPGDTPRWRSGAAGWLRSGHHVRLLGARPVLDRAALDGAAARLRAAARDLQGLVEVGGLDHPEAADLLLALGERAVGRDDLAALRPDDRGGVRREQAPAEDPLS